MGSDLGGDTVLFKQQIFVSVLIRAPSIEYTSKLLPVICVLTTAKTKENYREIATLIKTVNETKYHVNFDHIKEFSCDMEWSLFTEFIGRWVTKAVAMFCWFHTMQRWMKNISVKLFLYK